MLALTFAAVIIAQSPLVRSGLSAILGASPSIRVVAEATPEEAQALDTQGVDVVVCDVADSAGANPVLDNPLPGVPVLALVGADTEPSKLLGAGARGVLRRDASAEQLSAASVAVASGLCTVDESLLPKLVSPAQRPVEPADGIELTPREQQVLELLAEGLSNKLIALRLDISEHTAKFHVNSLLDKLEADTRTDAVVRAARRGLLVL
ncbi:MAG: response regulator transcription factor [Pseudomonadota bacterium]|nr:MAG: DNA-binding response regulator [Pseudomonadota bacterium]